MGGFVYFSRTEGVRNWDLLKFSEFPEGLSTDGDDANLTIRNYLTDDEGDCIPIYQFSGTAEEANELLLFQAEQNAEGSIDGNVLKIVEEQDINGLRGYSFGEMSVQESGQVDLSLTDGQFQGVGYAELYEGLRESLLNERDENEPVSPCEQFVENNVDQQQRTGIPVRTSTM